MTNSDPRDACDYCGLPIASGDRGAADEPAYCCFGCRLAHSIMHDRTAEGDESTGTLTRLGLGIFFTMNVMVFSMALWSWDTYAIPEGKTGASMRELFRYACLFFSAPVLVLLSGPLAESAQGAARRGRVNTDGLLLVGVMAAFVFSTISLWNQESHVYFEVACVILVLVTLGRWLEANGKLRATQALQSLRKLLPETVRMVTDQGEIEKPLDAADQGDLLRVLSGERIPVDGLLERQNGVLDEQLVTGESLPRTRLVGDMVYGGTLNMDGDLYVRAQGTALEGTVQRIVDRVAEAAATKGEEQRFADRLTQWFSPLIALVCLLTFWAHYQTSGFQPALMAALSVVVIACPCALGIATPLAVWAALAHAARHHVLFRDGDALSRLARVRVCCFDKTGTLSRGTVELVQRLYLQGDAPAEVDAIARRLSLSSNHVLGHALRTALATDEPCQPLACRTVSGQGVVATAADGTPLLLGSLAFARRQGYACNLPPQQPPIEETTHVCVGKGGLVLAVYSFREELRAEAARVVSELQADQIAVRVLTGDTAARAQVLADALRVEVEAELLPEAKLRAIQQQRGKRGTVAMVGDGVNDAPALAAADIGIALDCGADVSRDSADVCLLGSTLQALPWVIRLARAARRTIYQNLFWALAYNVVGVGFAASGRLNPILAAIAMVGSSLFVIFNSLRLNAFENEGAQLAPSQTRAVPLDSTSNLPHQPDTPRASLEAA